MGHIANGDVAITNGSGKRFLENGGSGGGGRGVLMDVDVPSAKYKKRKISATRDWPPGCGPKAPILNGKSKEKSKENGVVVVGGGVEVENSKGGAVDALVESSPVKQLESSVELKTLDGVDTLDKTEPLVVETAVPLQEFAPMEAPEPVKTFEPMLVDTSPPENSVQVEVSDHIQSPVTVDAVVKSEQKKFPPRRNVSAIRDFPPGCGRGVTRDDLKESRKSIDCSKNRSLVSEKPTENDKDRINQAGDVLKSKMKEKKEIGDAVQVKPAEGVKKYLEQKVNVKSKMKEKKEIGDAVQVKPAEGVKKDLEQKVNVKDSSKIKSRQEHTEKASGNILLQNSVSQLVLPLSKKVDRGSASSDGKLGTKDMSFKKKFPGKSVNNGPTINRSQEKLNVGVDSSDDREVVQCIMAQPRCPWGAGKKPQLEQEKKTPQGDHGKKTSKSASGSQLKVVKDVLETSDDDRVIVLSLVAAPKCPWRHGKKPFKSPSTQIKQRKAL